MMSTNYLFNDGPTASSRTWAMDSVSRLTWTLIVAWLLNPFPDCRALDYDEPVIEQVHVIFRRGMSTPLETYSNDPNGYIKQLWGVPAGMLIDEGKNDIFTLGKLIRRQLYHYLLGAKESERYGPGDIYVRSVDADRNILSAQILMSGYYYGRTKFNTHKELSWTNYTGREIVPIHTVPVDQDYLLSDYDCPYYDQLLAEQYLLALEKVDEDGFLDSLTNLTNYKIGSIKEVVSLYAVLDAQERAQKTLPQWLRYPTVWQNQSTTMWDRIKYTADLVHGLYAKTEQMQRLHGGPLLANIATQFNQVLSSNGRTAPIMFFYSVESSTIANLLTILEKYKQVPDYGETIAVELHRIHGQHHVQIKHIRLAGGQALDIVPLSLPGHGFQVLGCSLDEFSSFVGGLTSTNLNEECRKPDYACVFCTRNATTVILSLIAVIVFLVMILILLGIIEKYRKDRKYSQQTIEAKYHFHEKEQPWKPSYKSPYNTTYE